MISRTMAVASLLMLAACSNGRPAPIAFDADTCARCHMQISDRHYAAAIVTKHGRTLKFDSIDCLRAYYTNAENAREVASVWVADFAHPGIMLPAARARYADVGASRSPMGKTHGWAAFANRSDVALAGADSTRTRAWDALP